MECPCGSGRPFDDCCGPIVHGGVPAPTAEALMRSRFTAFALGLATHVETSWAPETRPADVRVEPDRRWTRLDILATERGRQLDADGVVEFRAHWEQGDRHGVLHERSRFRRDGARWVYVDGD